MVRSSDRRTRKTGGERRTFPKASARPLLSLLGWCALCGCEPELTVGKWTCAEQEADTSTPDASAPVALGWSTGFEDRFCDYTQPGGFCYAEARASYEIVSSPVRSGRYAAAFTVESDDPSGTQARCVRQGGLPSAAYYGAWYFVPAPTTNFAVWNLFHFQGGTSSVPHGLWDVSLVNTTNGQLRLVVFDFLSGLVRTPIDTPPIPIGSWFHLQFYFKRAANATGEVALYQDGRQVFAREGIITDDSDWGQWFVGNYADGLMPADSTLYVDDVTISATR